MSKRSRTPVGRLVSPPSDPMGTARELLDDSGFSFNERTIRAWRGGWMYWTGTHWIEVEDRALRSEVYRCRERTTCENPKGDIVSWEPNRKRVSDVVDALAAIMHLPETVEPPTWLNDVTPPYPAGEIVACQNGILHVSSRDLLGCTPDLFNTTSVPFDYDPAAPDPVRWLAFLDEVWPDDAASVAALQEFFGYVISGRTDMQKIALVVGPTRSGKGTLARVLTALVGRGNAAGPTLASLGTNFGLSPLLGKPLAIVSDARLGDGKAHAVVERLLSISGEDMLTIDRKYREPWTGRLPSRFLILSNELPSFGDASAAIANRFVVLTMQRSFLGVENPRLTDELLTELPGILRWALDGLDQLTRNGCFTVPTGSREATSVLADLASPVTAFVTDRCESDPAATVPVKVLHAAWRSWCWDNDHRVTSVQTFGRDLRAIVPNLHVSQPREGGARVRVWQGIRLRASTDNNDEDRVPSRANVPNQPVARAGTQTTECKSCGRTPDDRAGLGTSGLCVRCERSASDALLRGATR